MDKYEYKCEAIGDPVRQMGDVQAYLNSVAYEGWRLVAITPARYGVMGIFERLAIAMPVAAEVKTPVVKHSAKAKK